MERLTALFVDGIGAGAAPSGILTQLQGRIFALQRLANARGEPRPGHRAPLELHVGGRWSEPDHANPRHRGGLGGRIEPDDPHVLIGAQAQEAER